MWVSSIASASLVFPVPKGLAELVTISPMIVLARASKKPAQVRTYPIDRVPAGTPPYVRTSAAFDVLRVLRGPSSLGGSTIYVDPAGWQLFRGMNAASIRGEPVPSPYLAEYVRAPKEPLPGDADVILFLRPSLDDGYEETMLEGREAKTALPRVIDAVKAASK